MKQGNYGNAGNSAGLRVPFDSQQHVHIRDAGRLNGPAGAKGLRRSGLRPSREGGWH